jgi:hypothetical protein
LIQRLAYVLICFAGFNNSLFCVRYEMNLEKQLTDQT